MKESIQETTCQKSSSEINFLSPAVDHHIASFDLVLLEKFCKGFYRLKETPKTSFNAP